MKKTSIKYLIVLLSFFIINYASAVDVPISRFPLADYNQNLNAWFNAKNPNYNKPLLSETMQQQRTKDYYNHLFSTNANSSSPWNGDYITHVFQQSPDLKTFEEQIVAYYDNKGKQDTKIGYDENFRQHTENWINNIKSNIKLDQFDNLVYSAAKRGIVVTNLHGRVLPTNDVDFYDFTLPGQGYPFDNLQMSSVWAGTPVYIVAQSQDSAWDYVITPSFLAWVPSKGVATVSDVFVSNWQTTASQNLAAITQTKTPIVTNGIFRFYGYVGSVFPASTIGNIVTTLSIPVRNQAGEAEIQEATVDNTQAARMPLKATPHEFSNIIATLLNRPYGWGGMYFYNDCSAELKSLYTPFGIWLPRHSSDQVTAGTMVDVSSASMDERLSYLLKKGDPLMTIIYIDGHIVLYIGNYPMPNANNKVMAMTYQNLWGLSPKDGSRRSVIGESVLFPMLKKYPQDTSLTSLADRKIFQVSFLNQWSPALSLTNTNATNLKGLMYPEWLP